MDELRLAIVGDPVAHSLSPALHRAAMERLNLRGSYEAIQVRSSELPVAVARLKAAGVTGFNVTLPHKEAILPLLDDVDPESGEIAAVNTVEVRGGILRGRNTDRRSLRELLAHEQLRGRAGLLVGAGGAAHAAAFALGDLGIASLTILNRDTTRARCLVDRLSGKFPAMGFQVSGLGTLEMGTPPSVVINATSLGLRPGDESPLPPAVWRTGRGVAVDLVYGKHARFLESARENGWRTVNGLAVLVRQGLLALQIWSGVTAPAGLEAEILEHLARAAR
jgi:shikimate dehydrogenase